MHEFVELPPVVEIAGDLRGVLLLRVAAAAAVEVLEVGAEAEDLDAIPGFVLPHEILEVQPTVEAGDLAGARRKVTLRQRDGVVAEAEDPIDQHGRACRNEHEIRAATVVLPAQIAHRPGI